MTNKKVLKKRTKKENINQNSQNSCPGCNSTVFIRDDSRGELICKKCGLVLDENLIDYGPEWVAYNHEQETSRAHAGAPATNTLHDYGMSTDIAFKKNASPEELARWYRMNKLHKRSRILNSRQRNLAFALSQINTKCSLLALQSIVDEDACVIYRQALEKDLIRGRTVEAMSSASILISCKRNNITRTLSEIAEVSNASRREIARNERLLKRELDIKVAHTSPADYVPRFATELGLSDVLQAKAIRIIEDAKSKGLISGKGPSGIAAAAIYMASIEVGEKINQRQISEVAGITDATLKNHYNMLSNNLDI
jgi:transcription initiation factor TFIIB